MLNRSSCCSEFLSSIFSGWHPEQHSSPESSEPFTSTGIAIHAPEVCTSLYELHRPEGTPSMQVLFFHGLQLGEYKETHLITWESADGKCLWPQTWLVEEFQSAHVFCVWYSGHVTRRSDQSNESDMFLIGENLISDLVQQNIGQVVNCPVILVGHSIGGLVIKEVCVRAFAGLKNRNEAKYRTFLDNVRGVFYYATPHHGSKAMAELTSSPLLQYYSVLSTYTARLNSEFEQLSRDRRWRIGGLGEFLPTQWRDGYGRIHNVLVVQEASARVENFYTVVDADHLSICKPESKKSASFQRLMHFLSNIATEMKEKAKPDNLQHVPEFIVGIDFPVQDVSNKLVSKTPVALVGMGGLGKTTLAKAVFNNLIGHQEFEYSCFVPDVKDIKGDEYALKQDVWKEMHCHGKRVTKGQGWHDLRAKRLLLVLDDISDYRDGNVLTEIAESVSPESRFIVTSRNKSLISRWQGDIYEVPFLNEVSSSKLFKSCAFPTTANPPPELESITESIVKKCDGLPLTLDVLGRYLYSKTHDTWEDTLHALDKADEVQDLQKRLWAKLQISYDDLGQKEKQIFLDATTFFSSNSNWTLCEAKAAWSTVHKTKSVGLFWQTLVNMSLVYQVKEDEIIKVHEQLQSLGRKIASDLDYNDRIWEGEDMLQTIQDSDSKDIHALRMEFPSPKYSYVINLPSTACHKLKKLHFLQLHNRVVIDGAKEDGSCPTELVLLRCVGQTFLDPTLQTRLTVLKVSELEHLPDSLEKLSALAYLEILSSYKLSLLPDSFGKMGSLKVLSIQGCGSLQALPESFGKLKKLERLKFLESGIGSLPESFGKLPLLNDLTIWRCPLQTLPGSFGELPSLNHLYFFQCQSLKTLPESFGRLPKLKFLKFKQSGVPLPESFGELRALEHLEFDMCGPGDLPDSFSKLNKLRCLIFSCCYVKSLPADFGQLEALDRLEIYKCGLDHLPESFGQLKAMRYLQLYECPIKCLPESFWGLSDLNHLELNCPKLDALSESFGNLTGLQSLTITVYTESIPKSLGDLKDLRTLKINFHSAASIPESIKSLPSLQTLKIHFIPGLDNLQLPPWLIEPNPPRDCSRYSSIEYQVRDGSFSVISSS